MICGVDEAGKGPVIGPMVVAAVLIDNAKQIEGVGFKDSKLLTIQKRRELFDLIKQNYRYAVEIIKPEEIDKYRRKRPIKTSHELASIINDAKKNYNKYKRNPATKTFQAIRIFVNKELTELILGLIVLKSDLELLI